MSELESRTLAELHSLASKAGIEKFRLLRREELIDRLGGGTDDADADGSADADGGNESGRSGSRRSRRSRRRRSDRSEDRDDGGSESRSGKGSGNGSRSEKDQSGGEKRDRQEDAAGEPDLTEITGTLDILPRGSGVIRGEGAPEAGVHVSPAQIRRCELRAGDEVSGPVRAARRGERRPSLVRVEKVNGSPPADERSPRFDSLTPIAPNRPIPLAPESDDVLARAADLLVPLAFGQRVLVEASPRSGRTSLLKALARAILAGSSDATVSVLLVDERPEEVTGWRRDVPGVEIAAAPADLGTFDQVKIAQQTLTRARRQAEAGDDVVLMIDSLTRLGSAFGDAGSIKPFFGVGRELEDEGAGSVTVIAVALIGSPGDQAVLDAVHGSENATIKLDAALAAFGVTPSLDISSCVVTDGEGIVGDEGNGAISRLKVELDQLDPSTAAARLVELIRGTSSNEELRKKL